MSPIDATDEHDETLAHDDDDDSWFEQLREAESRPPLGTAGPFELLEEVSRGGQGVVFRARRRGETDPLALKRLVDGALASTRARQRFEREVEAASALNHPNIVHVHGMEIVDSQPAISMEWIDGVPINAWVASRTSPGRATERETVRVFLEVVDAVVHAHQKGVIHRDLKPSNVLVDSAGRPHLLDFGLAKWTPEAEGHAAAPPLTRTSNFLGTPSYAAPEQLRGDLASIDVRSDVYALGVILYELLTGELPYSFEGDLNNFIAQVETGSPPRASVHWRGLSRDLSVIALKALAVEPERRYQSADALADDLRRYAAGRPISAHPASSLYHLRRLIVRKKWPFAFGATVLFFLALFAINASREAERERNARLAVERERDNAETAARTSEAIQRFLIEDILSAADRGSRRHEITIRDVLAVASENIPNAFPDNPLVAASLDQSVGEIYLGIGNSEAAERHLTAAFEAQSPRLEPDHVGLNRTVSGLGLVAYRAGQFERANELLETALVHQRARVEDDPLGLVRTLDRLARLRQQGQARFEEAEALLREALALERSVLGDDAPELSRTMARLTNMLTHAGKYEESKALALEVLKRDTERLGHKHLAIVSALRELGRVQMMDGSWRDAIETYTNAIKLYEDLEEPGTDRILADLQTELARVQVTVGLRGPARQNFELATDFFEQHQGPGGEVALGMLRFHVANLEVESGNRAEAERLLRESIAILTEWYGPDHQDVQLVRESLRVLLFKEGRLDDAIQLQREALDTYRRTRGEGHRLTADASNNLGVLYMERKEFAAARPHFETSLRSYQALFPNGHPQTNFMLENLAAACIGLGELEAAERYSREGIAAAEVEYEAGDVRIGKLSLQYGRLLAARKAHAEALPHLTLANSILDGPVGQPGGFDLAALRATTQCLLATGDPDGAESLLLKRFEQSRAGASDLSPHTLSIVEMLGELLMAVGRDEEAAEWRELGASAATGD